MVENIPGAIEGSNKGQIDSSFVGSADKKADSGGFLEPEPVSSQAANLASTQTDVSGVKEGERGGGFKVKFFIIGILVLLILAVIGGGVYFYVREQREKVKDLAKKQLVEFEKLDTLYSEVLDLIKGEEKEKKNADLLRALEGEEDKERFDALALGNEGNELKSVLGLEESEEIVYLRKEVELFRKGVVISNKIGDISLEVKEKYEAPLAGLYLPKDDGLIEKTTKISKDLSNLFLYLEKLDKVLIDYFSYIFELGVLLNETITQGGHEIMTTRLEEKINEMDEIKGRYMAIDTSSLSEELKKEHTDSLLTFDKVKEEFVSLLNAIKRKDAESLVRIARQMMVEGKAASEKGEVDSVSFWENNATIRSGKELKREWKALYKSF